MLFSGTDVTSEEVGPAQALDESQDRLPHYVRSICHGSKGSPRCQLSPTQARDVPLSVLTFYSDVKWHSQLPTLDRVDIGPLDIPSLAQTKPGDSPKNPTLPKESRMKPPQTLVVLICTCRRGAPSLRPSLTSAPTCTLDMMGLLCPSAPLPPSLSLHTQNITSLNVGGQVTPELTKPSAKLSRKLKRLRVASKEYASLT